MLLIQLGAEKDRERGRDRELRHVQKTSVFHGILWRREPNSVRFFVDSLLFPTLGGEGFNKGLWSVDNYGPIKNNLKRFGSVRVKGFLLKPRPSMQGLQVKNLRGHSSTQKSGLYRWKLVSFQWKFPKWIPCCCNWMMLLVVVLLWRGKVNAIFPTNGYEPFFGRWIPSH